MPQTEPRHLDDVVLLALLHGEISPTSDEVSEHLRGCAACRTRLDALRADEQHLAELLVTLDSPMPVRRFSAVLRVRRRHALRRTVIAAGITIVAVTAAAALPFSPVHSWLRRSVIRPPSAAHPDTPKPTVPQAPAATTPAGISIPAPAVLAVEFLAPQEFGTMEITRSGGEDVELRSTGGTVAYEVVPGKIVVDNRSAASRYFLVVPTSLQHLQVVVNGRVVFRIAGDAIIPKGAWQETGHYVVVLGHLPRRSP